MLLLQQNGTSGTKLVRALRAIRPVPTSCSVSETTDKSLYCSLLLTPPCLWQCDDIYPFIIKLAGISECYTLSTIVLFSNCPIIIPSRPGRISD